MILFVLCKDWTFFYALSVKGADFYKMCHHVLELSELTGWLKARLLSTMITQADLKKRNKRRPKPCGYI